LVRRWFDRRVFAVPLDPFGAHRVELSLSGAIFSS
jgi:hypothetical protein